MCFIGKKEDRTKLELSVVDLFGAFLTDIAYSNNSQCFIACISFTFTEMMFHVIICYTTVMCIDHGYHLLSLWNYFLICININVTLSYGLAIWLHGEDMLLPDTAFYKEYLSWDGLKSQLLHQYNQIRSFIVETYILLVEEYKIYRGTSTYKNNQQGSLSSQDESVNNSNSNEVTVENPMPEEVKTEVSNERSKSTDSTGTVGSVAGDRRSATIKVPKGSAKGKAPKPASLVSDLTSNFGFPELKFSNLERREMYAMLFTVFLICFGIYAAASRQTTVIVFFFLFLVAYFVEALICPVASSLKSLCEEEKGYNTYLKARMGGPSFYWTSVSYHYETVTTTHTRPDGSTYTTTQQVRVNTHYANMYYDFDDYTDTSNEFPTDVDLMRVYSKNQYNCFDAYTEEDKKYQWDKFVRENDKDTHQDVNESFAINGSTNQALPNLLIYSNKAPYFMKYTYYLCSVLTLTASIYRWGVTTLSAFTNVNIIKTIRKLPPTPAYDEKELMLMRFGSKDFGGIDE